MVFKATMVTFRMILLMNKVDQIVSWMMDEFIHWPKPYLLVLLATCDEIFSWMIECWMKYHLVSESNRNIVNLESPTKFTMSDSIIVD